MQANNNKTMDGLRPGALDRTPGRNPALSHYSQISEVVIIMKIVEVRTVLLSYLLKDEEQFSWSAGTTVQRNAILIEITTDEGIKGIGEVGDIGLAPLATGEMVAHYFKPMLVGHDPSMIQNLYRLMYNRSAPVGRKGLVVAVVSGIEQALWDIMGKAAGLPVYKLLGGRARDRIIAYASAGMHGNLSQMADGLDILKKAGYKAVKIRIGYGLAEDVELVSAAREALGDVIDLMVDAGQEYKDNPWNIHHALREARALEKFGLRWIEGPLAYDDIEGHVELAGLIDTPIATGENECSVYGFKELIARRGADIVQPDVTHAGGFIECRKIANMAEAYGLECAPHIFKGGVSLAANLHFIASTPNCIYAEVDQMPNPLRDELLIKPFKIEDGYIEMHDIPGLGVQLTEEIEHKYPYYPGPELRRI